MNELCCECKEPPRKRSVLVCADCGGWFHCPDVRVHEVGERCGVQVIGFRELLGRDIVPLCLRCDMAFRLRFGLPS